MKKKSIIITIIVILVLVLSICLIGYFYRKHAKNSNPVDVYPVAGYVGNYMEYDGNTMDGYIVLTNEQKVPGDFQRVISEVSVKQGDTVKVGDVLVSYDMTQDRLKLDTMYADRQVKQANLAIALKEMEKIKTVELTPEPEEGEFEEETTTEVPTTEEPSTSTPTDADEDKDKDKTSENTSENTSETTTETTTEQTTTEATTEATTEEYNEEDFEEPEEDEGEELIDKYIFFTEDERKMAIRKKQDEINEINTGIATSDLMIRKQERAINQGDVTAEINGVVTFVDTSEENIASGKPIIIISSAGTYQAQVDLSEMNYDSVNIGDTVDVYSYDQGETYTGTVASKSISPKSSNDGYGDSNNSLYPMLVSIDDPDVVLEEGAYVDVKTYGSSSDDTDYDNQIVLPLYLCKEENGSYYVMAQDNGRLKKKYIKTGKIYYGSSIQVISGLESSDFIAFPYLKDAVEGKVCKESELDEYY